MLRPPLPPPPCILCPTLPHCSHGTIALTSSKASTPVSFPMLVTYARWRPSREKSV